MRELEFLPEWYPRARRRKRQVVAQTWSLLIVGVILGGWIFVSQRNVSVAKASLNLLGGQLKQSQEEQRVLEEQLRLRQELQSREQLITSLGYPVEMTRLIRTVESAMPKEMSLLDFSCDTEEQARQVSDVSVARAVPGGGGKNVPPQVDRRLRVKLSGVAPSDVDLANFLAGLSAVPFFEQVVPTYARGRNEDGHALREFEVTFVMNLSRGNGAN